MNFKSLKNYIFLARPVNLFITPIAVILGGVISGGEWLSYGILIAALSAALTAAGGNVINDLFDIQIDKINRPERPLASSAISIRSAWIYYGILVLISISLSALINTISLMIVLFSSIMIFNYSWWIKKIPLLGNFVVAFFTGFALLFGGASVNNIFGAFIPAAFAFYVNFVRELVKDWEDIEGDIKNGIITFPSRAGKNTTCSVVRISLAALIFLTWIPFWLDIYKIGYFIVVTLFVDTLFVYLIKDIRPESDKIHLRRAGNILKLCMIVGIIAIFLGI